MPQEGTAWELEEQEGLRFEDHNAGWLRVAGLEFGEVHTEFLTV